MLRLLPLIALFLALPLRATAAPDPKPHKIGFVDVKTVFEQYGARKTREQALRKLYDEKIKALQGLAAEIKELKDDVALYNKGSRARLAKEKQLYMLQRKFEFRRKWAEGEFNEQLSKTYARLYQEIQAAVTAYAKSNNYDAVFQVNPRPIAGGSEKELKVEILTRGTLYYRKSLDLTEDVIRLLNGRKKGAKKDDK